MEGGGGGGERVQPEWEVTLSPVTYELGLGSLILRLQVVREIFSNDNFLRNIEILLNLNL